MGTAISVFPADSSRRWIIAPGVASTRQIVARNDSAETIEIHLKVEQPAAASISPAVLTLNPRQSRNADVIVLTEWSPETETRVVISVRDAHGNLIVNLAQELIAMKQVEQAVVGPSQVLNRLTTPVELTPPTRKVASRATYATLGIALAALVIAGVLYLRPQEPAPQLVAPYHFSLAAGSSAVALLKRKTPRNTLHPNASAGAARQTAALQSAAALVAVTQAAAATPPPAPHESNASATANPHAGAGPGVGAPTAAAAGSNVPPPPRSVTTINRGTSIVALADPTVTYASGGRAVAVTWYVQSQDHAYIHLLNDRSIIIAASTVPGSRSHAIIRLPRGYHGGVSVEVIAIGYRGERVVQSASLSPPGTGQ